MNPSSSLFPFLCTFLSLLIRMQRWPYVRGPFVWRPRSLVYQTEPLIQQEIYRGVYAVND